MMLGALGAHESQILSTNFNANNGGLTAAVLSGSADNPFTYSVTAGVGGAGDWFASGTNVDSVKT